MAGSVVVYNPGRCHDAPATDRAPGNFCAWPVLVSVPLDSAPAALCGPSGDRRREQAGGTDMSGEKGGGAKAEKRKRLAAIQICPIL